MSDVTEPLIRRLDPGDAGAVVDVLSDAFADYPVMRHVLGDVPEYGRRLTRLVGLFVMARVLRGEPLFGIGPVTGLEAAAIVSYPGRTATPPEFAELRAEIFGELGADVQARYEAFGAATQQFDIAEPHIHLNMIGVRQGLQGRGLGGILLAHVHRVSSEDADSSGVTLTTEDPANVPLYQRLGYRLTGHVRVAPGLETWGFYRPDS